MKELAVIGRAEKVSFPKLGIFDVPAKIDTGADASTIWCSRIEKKNGKLSCVFFGEGSPYYTGQEVTFNEAEVNLTRVANSFGQKELRYKVKIPMRIKGRLIKATFTLTDRSTKLYPILIGRSTLQGKFVVDVSQGAPLEKEEKERRQKLEAEMKRVKEELNL